MKKIGVSLLLFLVLVCIGGCSLYFEAEKIKVQTKPVLDPNSIIYVLDKVVFFDGPAINF